MAELLKTELKLKIYNRQTSRITEQFVACTKVSEKNGRMFFNYKHPFTGTVHQLNIPVTHWKQTKTSQNV